MLLHRSLLALCCLGSSITAFVPSHKTGTRSLHHVSSEAERTSTLLFASNEDGEDSPKRRGLILGSLALPFRLGNPFGQTSAAPSTDYKAVASDIAGLVKGDPDKGPTLVRLAWHSSGTYDKMSQTGGSRLGTIRFKEELAHGGNAGLGETAVSWLEPIKQKYPSLSYADLYTLGGVTAIKTMGGPTIPWGSGRVDSMDPSDVTPDGRLPNADSGPPGADASDADHLRTIFNRMGFNDQEIVALSGAHALGRCHTKFSGYENPWTPTPTTFNNLYFTFLKTVDWTPRDWSGPYQYEDASKKFMMLPTDLVLIKDDSFKKYVDMYAADEAKFFADFSQAFQKLESLGAKNLVPTEWA